MSNPDLMAQRIKEKRTELGLTMEELGVKVGVQKSAVNKWEKGSVSNMKRSTIERLAEIFDCSPAWLMGMDKVNQPGIYVKKKDGTEEFVGDFSKMHFYEDPATAEFMEFLHKNPEYSILFDASTKVKKEDIAKALRALGIFTED